LGLTKAKAAGRALGNIGVDGGYQPGCVAWAHGELGYPLAVVARPPARKGFAALPPRRWVVERSFASIGRSRRLSKDDAARTATREAMIWTAFGTTMLRRLTKRGTS
jgi:putative transposase